MSRTKRKLSSANIYHIIARGVGQQIIFEDANDKEFFLRILDRRVVDNDAALLAWCLMDNHFHLVLQAPMESISALMHAVESTYALYFNNTHQRVGTLFQGRFTSIPIETDEQLIAAVRYIHLNPVKIGNALNGAWSSYKEYVAGAGLASTDFLIELLGGMDSFIELHSAEHEVSIAMPRHRLTEKDALDLARHVLGKNDIYSLKSLEKQERDRLVRSMKEAGLSIRQICRITGIGQGIVTRA